MKRGALRGGHSNLPVPKASRGSPGSSKSLGRGSNFAHSAEDIPRRVQIANGGTPSPQRRAISPGDEHRRGLSVPRDEGPQAGVRYITEDLIKKIAKEDVIDMITNLNLTLAKEGGKKIKYIENLDRLKRLQVLNLSSNMIERIEKLEKLIKLKELNLSYNNIAKIEGLENLTNLQVLNLTGNFIEHIPVWMGKRLKALRTLHLGRNNLQSLSELAKLKPLPDLTQLTIAENPVAGLPHCRLYLVFHLRTLEVLDSQPVTERDRQGARERFEQEEVERLEKKVEQDDSRLRKLEEEKNLSAQESSFLKAKEEEYLRQQRMSMERMQEMERELTTKDDLLKKKTQELNKACEKHYQLEQELAFYKIDSKFDSLGKSPGSFHQDADDSGGLGESPYLGRARFKANQFAREGDLSGSPQQHGVYHNISASPQRAEVMSKLNTQLDEELAVKQDRVQKTEDRLKRLQDDLMGTERKLLQATKDLKRMGDITDKDDVKVQLRQRLAKKMQLVNELRDSATQIEEEIDKTRNSMHQNKMEVSRIKGQLERLDTKDPKYKRLYAEMVDKEQQISESNQMYGQLQQQLEVMLDTIARETDDIKKLEHQLNDDRVESNETLRQELDDIVGGLQGYLASVKQKGLKSQRDFESLLGEKASLEEKVRSLEQELSVLDSEAGRAHSMEMRVKELEDTIARQQDHNRTLEDQINKSRAKDVEYQDRMESTSHELQAMKSALRDTERKVQNEKMTLERQVQTEREKAQQAMRDVKAKSALEEEVKRLQGQIEGQKQQIEEEKRKLNESIPQHDLKRRLRELSQNVKAGRSPISPQSERDFVGKTFRDLQQFINDSMNKSMNDMEQIKQTTSQANAEIQTLRENLQRAEDKIHKQERKEKNRDSKMEAERKAVSDELRKRDNEIQKLKAQLKEEQNKAAQGRPVFKIVHRPDSESDRSSLNSEEKALYDELQKELLELRRSMRSKEQENAKRLADAENEAALLEQMVKEQEDELMRTREENELEREKNEARMQVIAQDLDQARHTADMLQATLDERDHNLHQQLNHAEMNNQMITAQEEELTKLYDILEAQKDEIEHLNVLLDQLAQQGGGDTVAPAPGFDDELWRLRQEVNRLKETLAMQSAYVQSMPQLMTSAGTQAQTGGTQTQGGLGVGPQHRPNLSSYHGAPTGIFPTAAGRTSMGTSYAPPYGPSTAHGSSTAHGTGADPSGRVRTPPGGRPAGRSRSSDGRLTRRPSSRGGAADSDRGSHRSGRSGRSRSGRDKQAGKSKTAFEPVHRPQAYKPVMSTGPSQSYSTPQYAGGVGASSGQPGVMGPGAPLSGQLVGPGGQPVGAPYNVPPAGSSIPGYQPVTDTFQRSRAIPRSGPPLPAGQGQGQGGASTQTPGYAATQTPGYAAVQTPGYAATQTSGQGAAPVTYIPVNAIDNGQRTGVPGGSGRMYLPAYSTSPERPAGRMYYPAPGGGGGAPPPPPPPQAGAVLIGPPSPGPRVSFLPVAPIAQGTPVAQRSAGMTNASMTVPPSPIVAGSVGIDASQPRGILKNADIQMGDDTYLFCNVPEHHDLEDYIAELQEKLKRLKARLLQEQELQREAELEDDSRLVRRLRGELEERRDELEGLDLAIERQKRNLKDLRREEKQLEMERMAARDELEFIRVHNNKEFKKQQMRARVFDEESDSDDPRMISSRRKFLNKEVEALEKTLARRRSQLQDADKLLRECNTDLKEAREQARETVSQYDSAQHNLRSTVQETNELERRANEAGVELVKAADTLSAIRSEVKDMERKKSKQERLLRDINQVINKRDSEYKDLDNRVRSATQNLHRMRAELDSTQQREKETVAALHDAEEVLAKRRGEIARMRDQIEQQKQELERLDQKMGKKQTEYQFLQDTMERKSNELSAALREAEAEVNAKQREGKDLKDRLQEMEIQRNDLIQLIKNKRMELNKRKEEVETEDEVLQKLVNSVNKHKAELKHTFEMQKLEHSELENLKSQHSQKLAELEKTQRELIEEKAHLEQLSAEASRKSSEVDRLRQSLDRDRQEVERLSMEKQSLEDRLNAMLREKEMLDEGCKNLDNKMIQLKRAHKSVEDKMDSSSKRLETVETELRQREKELDELNHQRTAMQKETQTLKLSVKDTRNELKILKDHIRDSEDQVKGLDQDLKETYHRRDEAKLEYERLNEAIRQSRLAHDDYIRQEKSKQSELQELLKNVNEKSIEYQEAKMSLNKVRKEVEREEHKLNKLVSNANLELDNIRSDLESKRFELEQANTSVISLKRESEKLRANEEKFMEMDKQIKELEREVLDRNEEKNELAKALSRSYEELQKLRTESAQEMKQMQNRTSQQVTELQSLAEIQFNRANRLGDELNKIRKDNKDIKLKLLTQNEIIEKEVEIDEYLKELNIDVDDEKEEDKSPKHFDDSDFDRLQRHLEVLLHTPSSMSSEVSSENKENINNENNTEMQNDKNIKGKLTEEQDLLRHQLQEQMRRHAEAMESARMQSEGTIESLRQKLNALQDVLKTTGESAETRLSLLKKRSRSSSPGKSILDTTIRSRQRSTSPSYSRKGYLAQRPRSRSRSYERMTKSMIPERDLR